jgi:DNA-binding CsgD family transcriptional regulator
VQWLQLYLQGRSPEEIAQKLKLEIKQVYRWREKVTYHAIRVFALKGDPELVGNWLETSLQHHCFGLTSGQWQQYWQSLKPLQRQLLELFKSGASVEAIAETLNLKAHQVIGEWSKVYLAAQTIRSRR